MWIIELEVQKHIREVELENRKLEERLAAAETFANDAYALVVDLRTKLAADEAECERLRSELVKVYDAIGSEKVRCPRCGGYWFVPKQLWGDPRFDCPHCEAARAAGGQE